MRHVALWGRLFGTPLLIDQKRLDAMMPGIASALAGQPAIGRTMSDDEIATAMSRFRATSRRPMAMDDDYDRGPRRPYYVSPEGIAIITVQGPLVRHAGLMTADCTPLESYEAINYKVATALNDSKVRGIILALDTPGGEVSGCFDFVDALAQAAKGDKPIWAVADDMAFSAGYAIASGASRIYITRTGGVGSVGVVCCHCDQSGYDAQKGLKYTYIFAGAKKVDGNPHEALSDRAEADLQAEIDRLYDLFVDTVASNRGMAAEDVRGTEAGCYSADEAIAIGLADAIGTVDQAVADMVEALADAPAPAAPQRGRSARLPTTKGAAPMALKKNAGGAPAADQQVDDKEKPEGEQQDSGKPEGDGQADQQDGGTEKDKPPTEPPPADGPADPADVAEACAEAGVAHLAGDLIRSKATKAAVAARLSDVRTIKDMCSRAGLPNMFSALSKLDVEGARTALFDTMVARQGADTPNTLPAGAGASAGNTAAQSGWDAAYASVTGRK